MGTQQEWFLLGLVVVLVISVVILFLFREKTSDEICEEMLQEVSQHVGHNLSTEWLLLEEIMIRFEEDFVVNEFFRKRGVEGIQEKRGLMCLFCLSVVDDLSQIRVVPLTVEFVQSQKLRINALPPELRMFYETKLSIRDINPEESIIGYGDGRMSLLKETEETRKKRQDDLLYWKEPQLPDDAVARNKELNLIQSSVISRQEAVQFRRKLHSGIVRNSWSFTTKPKQVFAFGG